MIKPKIALICYHKNANKIYPEKWVDLFRNSILQQTYKDFHIYEQNYGGEEFRIFDKSFFCSVEMPTFVDSMNALISMAFLEKYDYVFNTNIDDYYTINRIERQLLYLKKGYEIVSSNFHLIRDDKIIHSHKFDLQDIKWELDRNNNPLAHPVIAYSKEFWKTNRYNPKEIPIEDMNLWKRSYKAGKFIILPDYLLYHRVHSNSVCQNPENR